MSRRIELREAYMRGWYELNSDLLIESTAAEFFFDDPVETDPVKRKDLAEYMWRWEQRARARGGNNQWTLSLESRQDEDGILTDWEWWELDKANLCGVAVVQTSDAGVLFERITYFDRNLRNTLK